MKVLVFGSVLAVWLCCLSVHVGAQLLDPDEVKALQAIRRNLKDPNNSLRSWQKGDPCSLNWTGVRCFNKTEADGYLHVRDLHLLNLNLSGSLSPELGRFSYMKILDFMWNHITGSIPKEIGKMSSLELLLLNGNQLTGPLPEELGFLPNLDRIQIDQNQISGPLPTSFSNLNKTKHFHMNNNSISGQLPPELSRLPSLVHLLLDSNNLSGYLPPEFSKLPNLLIIQLDNNQFEGSIPDSYANMSKLLKMSLRNCSLRGPVPDLSRIPKLGYLDLGRNRLNGSIPSNKLSDQITTIDLSYNLLDGTIPASFSGLPRLQRLSLENNSLSGVIPSSIWQNITLNSTESLLLNFQNNMLSNISGSVNPPANVSIMLQGNPVCAVANQLNIGQLCLSQDERVEELGDSTNSSPICPSQSCPEADGYEYVKDAPVSCFCAAPLTVEYRLKSPGFSSFLPYKSMFQVYLSSGLELDFYQLSIVSSIWERGPRLKMSLKLFPPLNNFTNRFDASEVQRLRAMLTGWGIHHSDIFGPYELLNFPLVGPYTNVILLNSPKSEISKGALAGIILAAVAGAVTISAIVTILIMRKHLKGKNAVSRKRHFSKSLIKVDGLKGFTFQEMSLATNNFSSSTEIGQGGYGKVYKGILADGTLVAVKRARESSLQGEKEFFTEIELLSRVHHRNLVSLLGYCDEEGEQMLVYEFMPNGTLRDHLSGKSKEPLSFSTRLRIALASAKGVLYLHTEADPPIFHRDIKASNILLDSKFTAKVADFGISKLAPVPDIKGIVPGHVSTVVKGTLGYLDPEYFLTHKLTDRSDVYGLGVVFLELLTGMQPISHGKNIVREVNVAYHSGMIFSVVDDSMGSYPWECVEKFVTLALKCCENDTDARPYMAEVVRELESIRNMMPESDNGTSESSLGMDPKKSTKSSYPSEMKNSYTSSDVSSEKKNPYVSSDVSSSAMMNPHAYQSDISGSDLVSGVVPSIKPR